MQSVSLRVRAANALRVGADGLLLATIVLIPFRLRTVLQARAFGTLYHDYTDFLAFASDITLIGALALWLLALAAAPRRISFGAWLITLPLLGLTLIAMLSTVTSVDPLLSAYHSVRLWLLFGFYLLVVNEVHSLRAIGVAVALQMLIQSVIGIAQILAQHSIGLQDFGELLLDPAWSGVSIVFADGVRSLRPYGLSDHPNILGGCLTFGLLVLALRHDELHVRWRMLVGTVFALGAVGLLLTYSRAAWLAFGAGALWCVLMFVKTRQHQSLSAWLSLAAASAIIVLPFAWQAAPFIGMRLNQGDSFTHVMIEDRSMSERAALNEAANQIFAEHLLLGVGMGALPLAMMTTFPDWGSYYQPAHVALLDVAAETGAFGGLLYLALLLAPWLALFADRKRITFTPALTVISGLLLALTVIGCFDYYTWLLAPGRLWQWLAWGLWAVAYQSARKGNDA